MRVWSANNNPRIAMIKDKNGNCMPCSDIVLTLDPNDRVDYLQAMRYIDACKGCPHGQYSLSQLRWLHLSFYELKMIKAHGPNLDGNIRPCPIPKWETQPEFWVSNKRDGESSNKNTGFGPSIFDMVKNSVDILDVAEVITDLQGVGNLLTGKCPLHQEQRGRSFVVWTDSQTWRCFGRCNTGGDVIQLVQECMERKINWERNTHNSMQREH